MRLKFAAVWTWRNADVKQVLLADLVNVEVLLARVPLNPNGNPALAVVSGSPLDNANANDPNIARIEKMGSQQTSNAIAAGR